MNDEIFPRLQKIFDLVFMVPVTVRPELRARDVPEWDSLTQISLIVAIEREFAIRLRLGDAENARNVSELAEVIRRHLERRDAQA